MFALILCFQSFGSVGVSASDNLIDSNLSNWELYNNKTKVVWVKGYYQLQIAQTTPDETGGEINVTIGAIYDLSDLVAGNSYKLNFHLVSPSDMGLTDSRIYNQLNYGDIYIGLASYDQSTNEPALVHDCAITITKDNYQRYFGYDTKYTFTMPNIENPCIVIYYLGYGTTVSTYFGFKNVSLIDTEAEKEQGFLDNLFQFFHDLKWEIVGGTCEYSGCSKTPHTSLADKITSKFQEEIDNLKQFFHDLKWDVTGGTCDKQDCPKKEHTSLAGRINTHIDSLQDSFVNKITELKQSFQNKIDELKQGLIDLKNDLIDGIKSLFVPDEQAILDWKESLNTLLKNHLGIIYTCSELLTDTLNMAFDIIFDAPDTYKISIPEVSFVAAGTTVPVFSAQNIDFSFMEKPVFKGLYSMYTVAMYIFFGALEVKYALRVYRKVMNN